MNHEFSFSGNQSDVVVRAGDELYLLDLKTRLRGLTKTADNRQAAEDAEWVLRFLLGQIRSSSQDYRDALSRLTRHDGKISLEVINVMSRVWRDRALAQGHLCIRPPELKCPIHKEQRAPRTLGFLRAFRHFCGKENKEHLELIFSDLQKCRRDMHAEGRNALFIQVVLLWHVLFGAILPISSDAVVRFLKQARKVQKLLRARD